jgi:hypothetical protein
MRGLASLSKSDTLVADLPPDLNGTPPTPRWVKVFGVIIIALVLLFVILKFTGVGGEHGPGRHMPSGSGPTNGETLLGSLVEYRLQQL